MSEKVIFEARVEETDDGYNYVFKHDKETFGESAPAFMKRFFPFSGKGPWAGMRKFRRLARRRMRRRLDFFERVYDELYGLEEEGVEE
jgi:hypothetical protein